MSIFMRSLASFLFLVAASTAQSQTTLRMAILGGVGQSAYGEAMTEVPGRISKATNGRVKVEIYDSLIPAAQQAPALRDGRVDMIGGIHPYLTGEEARFGIGHLPGLLTTVEEYKLALDKYMGGVIEEAWRTRYNGHVLAHGIWYENPHFSRKPLAKLSDFNGLKVRTHNAEAAKMLTQVGAHPTQIPVAEMTGALQRGVIDALSTELGTAVSMNVQDGAQYMSNWKFSVFLGWSLVANQKAWEKIPAADRSAIESAMKALQEERFNNYTANSEKKKEILVSKGIKYVPVTDEEQQKAFADRITNEVYADWYQRAAKVGVDGPAIISKIREILKK